jgi:hypothetical protein
MSFHMFTFKADRMPMIITPLTNESSAEMTGEHRTSLSAHGT